MGMVCADNFAPGRPRAPDRREVIRGLDLKARRAPPHVACADGIFHHVRRADQQAAAFVRPLFHGVRDNPVENGLTYSHRTSITMAVPMPPPMQSDAAPRPPPRLCNV